MLKALITLTGRWSPQRVIIMCSAILPLAKQTRLITSSKTTVGSLVSFYLLSIYTNAFLSMALVKMLSVEQLILLELK